MSRLLMLLGLATAGGAAAWLLTSRRPEPEPEGSAPSVPDRPPFPYIQIGPGLYLTLSAGAAFTAMKAVAAAEGVDLPLSTAWRSRDHQQRLYDAWLRGEGNLAAKPGRSLHEQGIAVDIAGINPSASNYNSRRAAWLRANAERFNFFNTGAYFSSPEPWHWVYGVRREGVLRA